MRLKSLNHDDETADTFNLWCSEGSNHSIFKNRKKQLHYKMSKKLIYQLTSKSVTPMGVHFIPIIHMLYIVRSSNV